MEELLMFFTKNTESNMLVKNGKTMVTITETTMAIGKEMETGKEMAKVMETEMVKATERNNL